jgi:hypothetical protein
MTETYANLKASIATLTPDQIRDAFRATFAGATKAALTATVVGLGYSKPATRQAALDLLLSNLERAKVSHDQCSRI